MKKGCGWEGVRREMEANRRRWDESVAHHYVSRDYDVSGFKRGRLSVHRLEIDEIGPVRGKSLLHLQCHFGMDTLSWARLGARVTGVDFSRPAVIAARRLAEECGLSARARFVESDVYDARRKLREKFDIVYTGKGALNWLPDIPRWARIVSRSLRPGGTLYFMETHPVAGNRTDDSDGVKWGFDYPYFQRAPFRSVSAATYATEGAVLKNVVEYDWQHTISEVLDSLIDAGLRIEFVHEFPFTFWGAHPTMRRGRDGWYRFRRGHGNVPMMWSVRARRE